jgi:hypothetical protein
MTMKKRFLSVCTVAFFILSFTLMVSGSQNVAEVSIGSSGIYWQPKVSYAQISLTVSCPGGQVFTKTFEGGSSPYLDLSDIKGQLIDGSYTYELKVTPLGKKKRRADGDSLKEKMSGDIPGFRNLIQTGYFTVLGGAIVTPGGGVEAGGKPAVTQGSPARPLDQVILDDLIVDGSLCVGMDCVNGESFGFDTIRLKENNLRIRFVDTSSTSSFPTNDWQITANDSANGGANKFSIDDIDGGRTPFTIEAGAPSNSLYVDDGGRVGFGTSTPVVDLHLKTGNTPTLRLEQDGSSGFTPQTWDVASNEANFFIRDATNGSTLPFRIQPGAPSSALSIMADGKVGIGTWEPTQKLHIKDGNLLVQTTTDANCAILFDRNDGQTIGKFVARSDEIYLGTSTASNIVFVTNNSEVMTIETDGDVVIGGGVDATAPYKLTVYNSANSAYGYSDGGAWATGSSREFKENIKDIDAAEALDAFKKLNPIRFNYKGIQDDEHLGFIAEDVPEIVATKNRDAITAMDMVTLLTKVVQEQQKTISELKDRISKLEKK